jgi:hypothetical protein
MKPAGGMPLINRKATVCKALLAEAEDSSILTLQIHLKSYLYWHIRHQLFDNINQQTPTKIE